MQLSAPTLTLPLGSLAESSAGWEEGGGEFLQWICNGVQSSHTEQAEYLSHKSFMVSCFRERKIFTASSYTDFSNYLHARRGQPNGRGGGGLLTFIHVDITFTTLNNDNLFIGDSNNHRTPGYHHYSRWCQTEHIQHKNHSNLLLPNWPPPNPTTSRRLPR